MSWSVSVAPIGFRFLQRLEREARLDKMRMHDSNASLWFAATIEGEVVGATVMTFWTEEGSLVALLEDPYVLRRWRGQAGIEAVLTRAGMSRAMQEADRVEVITAHPTLYREYGMTALPPTVGQMLRIRRDEPRGPRLVHLSLVVSDHGPANPRHSDG